MFFIIVIISFQSLWYWSSNFDFSLASEMRQVRLFCLEGRWICLHIPHLHLASCNQEFFLVTILLQVFPVPSPYRCYCDPFVQRLHFSVFSKQAFDWVVFDFTTPIMLVLSLCFKFKIFFMRKLHETMFFLFFIRHCVCKSFLKTYLVESPECFHWNRVGL